MTVNILNIKQYVIIGAFPVHTGINRQGQRLYDKLSSVPCTHRDKPALWMNLYICVGAFPVHTGINRNIFSNSGYEYSVPCTHRDKPHIAANQIIRFKRSLYAQG